MRRFLPFLCVQTGGCRIGCGGFRPPTTVATGTKATVPDGRETGGFGRGRDGRRGCSATRRMDSVSVAEFITVRFHNLGN